MGHKCVSSQAVDNPMSRSAIDHIKEAFYIGIGKLATGDGKQLADPEVLRRLTSSVSCALDEAAAALTRMRNENPRPLPERSLVEACTDGDVGTVRKLLTEGRSVHETTDEGESLLSLACSAGYYELAQVLLAMHANVEDRGIKGDCTPLMEAASSGYVDIVRLLIHHGADVNAQSSSGNTPLMYACAGGHVEAVRVLLDAGANVEDHNENGHTPLMEAASAGHVSVAEILLARGAGINTHSNEFKESALTLACYKGHLDMVRFLLEAGADQEHKTDEMHTALMEASMDGHVEVARLLLDSGAQVNMPTDSFESPLTLAACGGHVDLALLLIERGANIEEVNDEGYTPLMEAAREGHEDMVAVLLVKGANINAQTEETQETALTLACCGGFLEVANFLIKNGAEIELGASTPLMEAAQEGHLDLVRYLLEANADVNAQTQTGDTALTYACENGHTEVAKLLLLHGAYLEHESEGGRTPLMKACRAGHLCTVKFLLSQTVNVNKQTTNNDHTPLSLAAAGGHIAVVELLLAHSANPFHKLKDNSTMLIEAAKGGHTNVVQLLLDYPHSILMRGSDQSGGGPIAQLLGAAPSTPIPPPPAALAAAGLHDVPEAVRAHLPIEDTKSQAALGRVSDPNQGAVGPGVPTSLEARSVKNPATPAVTVTAQNQQPGTGASLTSANSINSLPAQKPFLRKSRLSAVDINSLTSPEAQQVRNQPPLPPISNELSCAADDPSKGIALIAKPPTTLNLETQFFQRQQIVEELQRVEQELKERGARAGVLLESGALSPTGTSLNNLITPTTPPGPPPDPSTQGMVCGSTGVFHSGAAPSTGTLLAVQGSVPQLPVSTSTASPTAAVHQPITPSDVVQATAISDRPKAKPTWKKEGKNNRKQSQAFQAALQQQQQYLDQSAIHYLKNLVHKSEEGNRQVSANATSEVTTNGSSIAPNGPPAANGSPPNKSFVKLSPMIRHSEVVTQLRAQQEDLLVLQQLNQIINGQCNELMQRRSPLLPQTDEDALIDLAKAGKWDQETLELFTPEQLEELAKMSPADRDRMRLSFMAGMEAASKLRASRPFPVVFEPMGLQSAAGAPNWHHVTPDIVEKSAMGAAIGRSLVDPVPCALSSQQPQQGLAPPAIPPATSTAVNAATQQFHQTGPTTSFLKAPPPWAKDLVPATPTPASAGTREQVQAGTQTSPAPDASNSAVAVQQQPPQQLPPAMTKKSGQALNSSGTGTTAGTKGRRTRFHLQQKSTQAPPIHPDSNHTGYPCEGQTSAPGVATFGIDVDSATDSNNDTALTLACAGGHEELCELLLSRGANIEHRDKKGFTPLILAATAGHEKVVEILMNHQADMEAQSERTKDTPLSLACSGGRYEVVELLLSKGANKEHRNVSDYTPLSLAASGGYVNIIKLLLTHGAEINSRTGSKLGISPLMLAAMNGHTAAVKLLLDMGSDINAQIETNRNTALTLACFQGRNEVVSLLLDRRANVEHRAKTGLTPLMEAASGGYVEVGRVLLDKGADVNAPPVPSSRDTALTIAADKGHCRFVELLLNRNAQVEVKNKKGNSPLWLAANGGHLPVVELLYSANADIDSQDNRKVSCLMAAFRKGHVKVVKWMVNHVTQFPSDQEMTRYITTVNDKELLEKCQECTMIIRAAKDQQAAKANKNATILLEELYMEKTREESKRAAAARKRERKKKKKLEKKEEKRKLQEENQKNERYAAADEDDEEEVEEEEEKPEINKRGSDLPSSSDSPARGGVLVHGEVEEGDSGIDANSQGSCSSNEVKGASRRKEKKKKKQNGINNQSVSSSSTIQVINNNVVLLPSTSKHDEKRQSSSVATGPSLVTLKKDLSKNDKNNEKSRNQNSNKISTSSSSSSSASNTNNNKTQQPLIFEPTRHPADREDFEATGNDNFIPAKGKKSSYLNYTSEDILPSSNKSGNTTSPKQAGKRDEGWKEVVRKYLNSPFKSKKVSVPLNAISRVIGRGGSNINAIRTATGAHIEVEKQSKGQGERIITLKGSLEATKQAHSLIAALVKDPEVDILQILPKSANKSAAAVWEKSVNTAKSKPGKGSQASQNSTATSKTTATTAKKLAAVTATKTTMSYTNAIMISSRTPNASGISAASGNKPVASSSAIPGQTFAAKLSSADAVQSLASLILPPVTTVVVISSSPLIAPTVAPPLGSIVTNVSPSTTSTSSSASALTTIVPPSVMSTTTSPPVPRLPSPPAQTVSPPTLNKPIGPPTSPSPIAAAAVVSVIAPTPVPATVITVDNSAPPRIDASPPPPPPPSSLSGSSSTVVASSTSPATSTTLEYSLFNDNFTKVTQQSVWGREADNQRREGMNFASAAATGAPNTSAIIMPPTSNKYLDPSPPTVDAAKAPGYRGNNVCSPVSKGSSSAPASTSTASTSVVGSVPYFPSQTESSSMANSYRPPPPAPLYQSAPPPTQADLDHPTYHPTSVTMSRLNPRAPDFSTTFKPQLYQQGGGNGGAPYLPPTILPNNNVIPFPPMGKFPGGTRGANGPARWSMMAPSHYATQSDVTSHLATLATISQTADLLGSTLENGSSPNVSPSSPQQQPLPDDRKVPPRPIGTERAWKNYTSMAAANAEIDMAPTSWMIESKMNWQSTAGLGTGPSGTAGSAPLDNRHAGYFRPGPTPTAVPPPVAPPFSRIALQAPEDIPHMLDTSYQGGLDSSQFSGGGAGISMMHHTPLVMPQHYAGVAAAAVAAAAAAQDLSGPGGPGTEWDQPSRPLPDLHQDKTHYYCSSQGWTTKWSH